MAKLYVFVPVLLLAVFVHKGESVRCWNCASDMDPNCNDPFLAARPENQYRYAMTNCDANTGATYPYLATSKSVCKKHKKYVNGQLQIIRGCAWKRVDDYSNICPNTASSRFETTSFCETCEFDGCNGAATIGTTLALILAPLSLLLFK